MELAAVDLAKPCKKVVEIEEPIPLGEGEGFRIGERDLHLIRIITRTRSQADRSADGIDFDRRDL